MTDTSTQVADLERQLAILSDALEQAEVKAERAMSDKLVAEAELSNREKADRKALLNDAQYRQKIAELEQLKNPIPPEVGELDALRKSLHMAKTATGVAQKQTETVWLYTRELEKRIEDTKKALGGPGASWDSAYDRYEHRGAAYAIGDKLRNNIKQLVKVAAE